MAHRSVPRIVFSDLDGTLLASDKSLPPENLRALDCLAERNVPFVPCTGRTVSFIPDFLTGHAATRYAVSANGAVVSDLSTGRPIHQRLMGPRRTLELYRRLSHLDITFDVFVDGRVMAERARYEALRHFGVPEAEMGVVLGSRTPTDLTIPEVIALTPDVERITIYWNRPEDRDEVLRVVGEDPSLSWTNSVPKDIEVSDASASKGEALRWLCGHLDLSPQDSVAFGDALNDVPMLTAAGDGVAMANAVPEALAAADHVAASNDEGGFGRYLEALGL